MTSTDDLRTELTAFAGGPATDLPLPGRGRTPERFTALSDLGRRDLAVARLCEAHADALAILADADRTPTFGATYGVWAARTRDEVVTATRRAGGWHLAGHKPWCTGVGIVSHALVTVESDDDGPLLVELTVDQPGIAVAATPWVTPAFAATSTATLRIAVDVGDAAVVGSPGSYLGRPGFWHGASGVAACWAGGVVGLADQAAARWRDDDHATAHRGAVDALTWSVAELVAAAGRDADAHPGDGARAHRHALRLRHLVDAAANEALTRVRRGCGPAPLAFDADLGRHATELELYVRQCHAERDLAVLGRATTPP